MLFHKRNSFFPLAVALLSLGLIVFMFYAFSFDEGTSRESLFVTTEEVTVSEEDYQAEVKQIAERFEQEMLVAEDALARLLITEQALDAMMNVRVPAEHQSLHLKMSLTLSGLKDILRSDDRDYTAVLQKWFAIVEGVEWLNT